MKNRILVIGGVHGNELLGIRLANLINKRPIKGVDAMVVNKKAMKAQTRFIETDLNRSFGVQRPKSYEERLAVEIQKICQEYDVVLDFHNTQAPDNNCSFVGVKRDSMLLNVSSVLGLDRCIEAEYDCINKYCQNVISVEISTGSKQNNEDYWYEKIESLVDVDLKSIRGTVTLYEFVSRVTWGEKSRYRLNDWRAFSEISEREKAELGVSGIITPIFVASKLTEYYATLVSKKGSKND